MAEKVDILFISTHAEEIITRILWPEGPVCPECGCHEYKITPDGRYRCTHCHKMYNIKTGTIFSGTRLPLSKWMICLYLMLESKGIGSNAMSRYLNIAQTTCYYMMMKLRCLFFQDDVKLDGEIAIDEEYIGGQWGKMCLSKRQFLLDKYMLPKKPKSIKEKMAIANKVNSLYKTPVFGMNNGDKLILHILPNPVHQEDVLSLFRMHCGNNVYTVSDCGTLYNDWESLTGSCISQNNHSKGQFTTSDGRSSNRIEGSFSQWKRQSLDKYCRISPKYLQLYLDEHCFRFNNRELSTLEKIEKALQNCHQKITDDVLRRRMGMEIFSIRQQEIFNPYEYFKKYGALTPKVIIGDVVYRKEEFVENC